MQPEIAAFGGGGQLPPRAANSRQGGLFGILFVLGRAKSCRWQVFVRRRPPKQGELRTDVSKATMFQGDRKVTKAARPPEMCREAARIVAAGRKRPPQAAKKAAERQKNLSLFVRSCFLGGLIRGLENLEAPFWKDLILFVRLCSLGALIRGSQNLESPCKGERIVTFCIVQKVTKKHAGLRPATCDSKLYRSRFQQSFPTARAEPGFSHKTAAKRL